MPISTFALCFWSLVSCFTVKWLTSPDRFIHAMWVLTDVAVIWSIFIWNFEIFFAYNSFREIGITFTCCTCVLNFIDTRDLLRVPHFPVAWTHKIETTSSSRSIAISSNEFFTFIRDRIHFRSNTFKFAWRMNALICVCLTHFDDRTRYIAAIGMCRMNVHVQQRIIVCRSSARNTRTFERRVNAQLFIASHTERRVDAYQMRILLLLWYVSFFYLLSANGNGEKSAALNIIPDRSGNVYCNRHRYTQHINSHIKYSPTLHDLLSNSSERAIDIETRLSSTSTVQRTARCGTREMILVSIYVESLTHILLYLFVLFFVCSLYTVISMCKNRHSHSCQAAIVVAAPCNRSHVRSIETQMHRMVSRCECYCIHRTFGISEEIRSLNCARCLNEQSLRSPFQSTSHLKSEIEHTYMYWNVE